MDILVRKSPMFRTIFSSYTDNRDLLAALILFNSHKKFQISACILNEPPRFKSPIPTSKGRETKSVRELYIESFDFLNLQKATISPFVAIHYLFRLDFYCWSQIITAIREEDHRINGISDTSVGHAEEIKRLLTMVQRGGSLGWQGADDPMAKECAGALEEDFKHLVDQTDLLWQNRDKQASIRQQRSQSRWNSLTNAFTYL